MTSIQKKAIPQILNHKNVVLKSETGSGKTMAYLVPMIEKLYQYSVTNEKIWRDQGVYALILAPTRELCCQIDLELGKLKKFFNFVVSTTIMGGENPKKEKARLRKGCTVLVCTPGRFLYHLENTTSLKMDRL